MRRTGKKRSFRKRIKKAYRKFTRKATSQDLVTISGSYLVRTAVAGQRGNQDWYFGQAWNYNSLVQEAYANDPVISSMFVSYEFVRLVGAKIKLIGCQNPTRDDTSIGYSAIAVDPKQNNTWNPQNSSIVDFTRKHKFCKVRAFPGNNSMKVTKIVQNCKEANMAIWQKATLNNSWYTDYKPEVRAPEYRVLIETTGGAFANNPFMGYIKVSYTIQFKNLKRHD